MDARGFFGVSNEVNRGYNNIVVDILVKGEIDEETLRNIANFSPAYEMVTKAIPVQLTITIN